MKLAQGHLTYCTNIHAGEAWPDHFESLKEHFPLIKAHVSPGQPMGIGLRLSNTASLDLLDGAMLDEFRSWLSDNDAYVFTMNGFPYGDFHHAVVKDQVHAPDWTTTERLEYTLRLVEILAGLLPAGMDGGISTSPLTYRHWFASEVDPGEARRTATEHVITVAEKLFILRRDKNILIHLDIEPEPDGLLETGTEFIAWYRDILLPMAETVLTHRLNITPQEAAAAIREHICLCYDVCHFAIGYEPHREVLDTLAANGIRVGKIQVSAALKAAMPSGEESRRAIAAAFSRFNEPTYLHQVVARKADRDLIRYRDLPEALKDIQNLDTREWRAHFHVPVFLKDMGLLESTQSDITDVLKIQKSRPFTAHLEVETYTWEVLPDSLKAPIDRSISRELNWVKDVLENEDE